MSDRDSDPGGIDDTLIVLGGMGVLYTAWTCHRIHRLLLDRDDDGETITIEDTRRPKP